MIGFPTSFLWGAATSAYQIEGSPLADGAGASIWHRFSREPGRVVGGATGDSACDHYRRYREDIALMAWLGINAYRFSVAWARVVPDGNGTLNPKGLGFYDRLVDALLAQGIEPMLTLYHWDLPAALEDRGGWLNPDSAKWFGDYAQVLFQALDDRVRLWLTLNEPWVSAVLGYLTGTHAPGRRGLREAALAAHHLLLAHAEAVTAYRAVGRHRIGIALNLEPQYAASAQAEDVEAAARRHIYVNRWFLDPILLGRYPAEIPQLFGADWPRRALQRAGLIRAPIDFLGVNYYSRALVVDDPSGRPARGRLVKRRDAQLTAMGWEIFPQGLTEMLLWIRREYGELPVYITENGAACNDPLPERGRVLDPGRARFLGRHLIAAQEALGRGVDLRGYFAWSLLDNFEWAYGYSKRFGLIHVDFATQRRTPKMSARFYRNLICRGGANLAIALGALRG
ncbi:GH1 family beta-glucosidase [Thioalkalicoccus limnaeus]|uniref:Beta-glucosidase n=1 Tax=Thioalkalicoccus limnaeus TaxID=120681 RepID=A0ABV4BC53_9GAMM